jgi:hypothetical protein
MPPDTDTQVQDQDQNGDQGNGQQPTQEEYDAAIRQQIIEALDEAGLEDEANRVAVEMPTLEAIKGRPLIDLRSIDPDLANAVDERKNEITQAREEQERADEQARREEERIEEERLEAERKARAEVGELPTYAEEHPVIYSDTTLPSKVKDRAAFHEQLAAFGKHTAAWKADRWDKATPEERGIISAGFGEPLHADLNGFTPKEGELSQLERQSLEAQAKAFKATKLFVDAPTLALVAKTEQQQNGASTRAESDAALQKLVHIAKGVEVDARSQLPFQTPYKRQVTLTGPDGEKTVVYEQRPDKTEAKRTADGGAIVTETDLGTGQQRIIEYSAEEYAEVKAELMLEAPDELPASLRESTITDEFSRPLHDRGTEPGEPTRVQTNPLAKVTGPETPEQFLEAHGKITKADIKLWAADVQARFGRNFPDAARALLRGEEVTEL